MAYSLPCVGGEMLKHALPNACLGPGTEMAVSVIPAAESVRQIPPWNAGSISMEHGTACHHAIYTAHRSASKADRL
jgi:hypothetical protein